MKKSPERTSPGNECITYSQPSTCLSLWFGGVMGISPTEFLSRYGSQSGRSGGASASSNAGIPLELWGHHGNWKSEATQRCYMQKDAPSILSVSRVAMGQHIPAPVPRGSLPRSSAATLCRPRLRSRKSPTPSRGSMRAPSLGSPEVPWERGKQEKSRC